MSNITQFVIEGLTGQKREDFELTQISIRVSNLDLSRCEWIESELHKTRAEILREAISYGLEEIELAIRAAYERGEAPKEGDK